MELTNKQIIIIHSGSQTDLSNADTLIQANIIDKTLKEIGFKTAIENINDPQILQKIFSYDNKNTIVFNLVETFNGSDSKIYQFTSLLDFLKIPYSGANSESLLLTANKILSKKILESSQIKTPKWLEIKELSDEKMSKKYIVKSNSEHCSIGIDQNSISDVNLLKIVNEKQQKYGGIWFAEEFIDGREFNISVMKINGKMKVLPIPEMVFNENFNEKYQIVDFALKWQEESPSYDALIRSFHHNSSQKLIDDLTNISLKICQVFNINSYARIDFRVDRNDQAFAIDINTNPCISPDSGFIATAKELGLSDKEILINILQNAQN